MSSGVLVNPYTHQSTASYDTDAQAFFDLGDMSGLSTTEKDAVNDLVVTMKADGIWAKMQAVYPFVGGTATTHKYNLKDPRDLDAAFRITFGGTITHNANGVQGDGSTGFGNTHWDVATDALDDFTVGFYCRTDGVSNNYDFGQEDANGELSIRVKRSPGTYLYSGSLTLSTGALASCLGSYIVTRTTNQAFESFYNGVSHLSNTSTASAYPSGQDFYILALNNNGSLTSPSSRQYAMYFMGAALTPTEASDFHDSIEVFQDALSRGVVA